MRVENPLKNELGGQSVVGSSPTLRRLSGAFWSRCGSWFAPHAPALPVQVVETPEADEPGAGVQSLVDEMLNRRRYALLLRRQLIGNLSPEQLERTLDCLATAMCLVPEGEVTLELPDGSDEEARLASERSVVFVDGCYLDRYPVTNADFRHFVARGGYEQMAIWEQEIWPAVLDFVDQTGCPGPRFWQNGRCAPGEDDHPVVGVCWYEAAAYARWVGKRLATDGEWVKAGSWPVPLAGHPPLGRRFPWGDAMDRARANLWGSGPGHVVPIDQFPGGISVGGVHQLIGNVWEWTSDTFTLDGDPDEIDQAALATFKSIRGGAFDTYLDSQASCHFRSGERALARKHNIGFRTAIGLGDLVLSQEPADFETDEQPETLLAEDES